MAEPDLRVGRIPGISSSTLHLPMAVHVARFTHTAPCPLRLLTLVSHADYAYYQG